VRFDRYAPETAAEPDREPEPEPGQLQLFSPETADGGAPPAAPRLPELAAVPVPPLYRVRTLSFTALSLFERCSYRYYAERVVGMKPADAAGAVPGHEGLAATEVGDAVHALLERIDLRAPQAPAAEELAAAVHARYPAATNDDVERIGRFVASYCESELAARIAALDGAAAERPFAFEHDGVLFHGRLDVLHRAGGRSLVVDYKTNSLEEGTPDEIVERDYRLQRLVYALACFGDGADEVELVYHFLERPDAVVTTTFSRDELPEIERELSAAIAEIQAGVFRPTPGEFVCAGCPALDVVCAGPRLPNGGSTAAEPASLAAAP
jgi:hypothetical protein